MDADPSAKRIDDALLQLGLGFLFPYQRLVVHNTLSGDTDYNRQIVILPTGAGKSLCFQLPAMVLPGVTVVIYPLLSLMTDQARSMGERGIAAAVLRGGQTHGERRKVFDALRAGKIRVIVTNPETLNHKAILDAFSSVTVDHVVIDEAHCLTQWGETFRPAYLTLQATIPALSPSRVTAFTATAGDATIAAIRRYIFPDGAHLVRANADRTNVHYAVVPAAVKNRTIARLIRSHPRPAIVFCRTRVETERTAVDLLLRSPELPVRFYHAGLPREQKDAIEEWFFGSDDGVLVSTCAYGIPYASYIKSWVCSETPYVVLGGRYPFETTLASNRRPSCDSWFGQIGLSSRGPFPSTPTKARKIWYCIASSGREVEAVGQS